MAEGGFPVPPSGRDRHPGASGEGNTFLTAPLLACRQAGTPPVPLWRDGTLAGQGYI